MSIAMSRVDRQLVNPHERRRSHKGRLPIYGKDLLHSLSYWRRYRDTGGGAEDQYRLNRSAAMSQSRGWNAYILAEIEAEVEAAFRPQPFDMVGYANRIFLGRAA